MMRAIVCVLVFVSGLGVATPAAASAAPAAAAAPRAFVVDQVLEAFFAELDAKAASLAARRDEEPVTLPASKARDALRAKLLARLPKIDGLRLRGAIGETNRGFVEARGPLSAAEQGLVSEENADRTAAYEALAELARARVDDVGRARARKIAGMSKRRVWLQEPDGEWRQKP